MTGTTKSGAPDPAKMSLETASRLLKLGMTGRRRPVDDLTDRLAAPDGATWLPCVLEAGPLRGLGSADALLAGGAASVEQLIAIKERSKAQLERAGSGEDRLAALAGYFFSIAAALRNDGTVIGGRSREERNRVLVDLAAVAPSPYREMLAEAAQVEAEGSS